jgi:hypothetical protein
MIFSHKLRGLHHDQNGASYSISVLFLIPIYLCYICMVIELILLFNSFQSITAAAQVCGHSVKVWWLHRDSLDAQALSVDAMAHRAATLNMLPFATTNLTKLSDHHTALAKTLPQTPISEFSGRRYAGKAAFIDQVVRVELKQSRRDTVDGIQVYLEYDSPLWFPALAPFFSNGRNQFGHFRTVSAQTWVPIPEDEFERESTGIPYHPYEVRGWK